MKPYFQTEGATVYHGDSLQMMKEIPDDSVDSMVIDGPYGIRFMGKAWDGADIEKRQAERMACAHDPTKKTGDNGGHRSIAAEAGKYKRSNEANRAFQEWTMAWAIEGLRVLKPGGHLVSFASPRTYHRMACGIEDAGFEIRDQLAWVFGSGFPKSHNLEGEKEGWGTALKPGWEPICFARKPLDGTVVANVAAHGTGALNIAACRIGTGEDKAAGGASNQKKDVALFGGGIINNSPTDYSVGRWPANLCHDGSPEVVALFPKEAGAYAPVRGTEPSSMTQGIFGKFAGRLEGVFHDDEGSAARFFYCGKATVQDREAGLEIEKLHALAYGNQAQAEVKRGNNEHRGKSGMNTVKMRKNIHPTVKPTALMRWLCRMVTPAGGTILDPFAGSGSTGKAALLEGFNFIGMEKEEIYLPIMRARLIEAKGELFA